MTTTTTNTFTTLDDTGLPARSAWEIDPGHAEVAFVGRHFMMTKVRGRFTDVTGGCRIGESMADSSVDVMIGMASVESGNPARDEHIRSAELFDVETFPRPPSAAPPSSGPGQRIVDGDLTLHGVTRRVPARGDVRGPGPRPVGRRARGLRGPHQGQPRGLRHHLERGARGRRRPGVQGDPDRDRPRDRPPRRVS